MESINIEVFLPGNQEVLEFSVPSQVPVGCYLGEMIKLITMQEKNILLDEQHPLLIDERHRRALEIGKTMAENHVRDSDRLILI